ncbi:hypothetical protein NMY22_g11738 [Coprinellus aureogranulatus]|nr:hypothetical protein NMY22_g11738 [Coprinellus aureogranulatus]
MRDDVRGWRRSWIVEIRSYGFDDYAAHVAGTNVVGYNCVAALALLLYDILLTVEQEVRVIWPVSWTFTKFLFFFVRYFTVLLQISVMFIGTPPLRFTNHECYIWNVYQGLSSVLIITAVDYILVLRVFALYHRSPGVRYFVAALYVFEVITMSVGLGLAIPKLKYDEYCTIIDSPETFLISAGAPIAFQSFLFAFTAFKFFYAVKSGWGNVPMMQLLMRDGTWAFILLFAILLAEAALYGFAPEAYMDLLYGWINTAFAVSGYRILLNLHSLNRPSSPSTSLPDTSPDIQFTSNFDTGPCQEDESYELRRWSSRALSVHVSKAIPNAGRFSVLTVFPPPHQGMVPFECIDRRHHMVPIQSGFSTSSGKVYTMESDLDYEYLVRVAARSYFANVVMTMVAIGVHIFMALYGLSAFFETSKAQRQGRALYIVISFLITGLSALSASLDCFWIFRCLFEATSELGFYETTEKYATSWERVTSVACFTVVIFIGDALLVYRCYIIWKHRWYVTVLPALAYLASVGMGILCLVPPAMGEQQNVNSKHEAAWIFLNVATNVMVTALISFHLLVARRALSELVPSKRLTLYNGVVAILIESALPLSLFGLVYASLLVGHSQETTRSIATYESAQTVFSFLYYAFTVSHHFPWKLPSDSASRAGHRPSPHHLPYHNQQVLGAFSASPEHSGPAHPTARVRP